MKHLDVIIQRLNVLLLAMMIVFNSACSDKTFSNGSKDNIKPRIILVSELYNDFDGGVLFHNMKEGLDVLWQASSSTWKEHLAFFIEDGILICPNAGNTANTASFSLPLKVESNKLFVMFEGERRHVLGIIHTHINGLPTPAPRNDFQYAHIGVHNYVMSYHDLYDAFKDSRGREVTKRLGPRWAYDKLPFSGLYNQRAAKD
jgi:hypothetical protein